MSAWISNLLQFMLRSGDSAEERRLPVGSKVRLRLEMTDKSQYTSKTWNEKKREALEKRYFGPVYTVKSHKDGWMRIEHNGAEHAVIPKCWDIVKNSKNDNSTD